MLYKLLPFPRDKRQMLRLTRPRGALYFTAVASTRRQMQHGVAVDVQATACKQQRLSRAPRTLGSFLARGLHCPTNNTRFT